jgi:HD-like signal output (HDOD) protein
MGHSHPDYSPQLAEDTAVFERNLAIELEGESLELPSFPEVALRVRKALGHAEIPLDEVVRLVGAEPSLSVRLLQLANSVALNPGGQRITSLRLAIARIGFNLARSATIAFAMSQMRRAEAWRGLEWRFRQLWEESATLAALAHAFGRLGPALFADQALLAGMLTSVGRLFVLTRLSRFPLLLETRERYFELERRWDRPVARAILAHWDLSPGIISAACDFESAAQPREGGPDLRDVLFVAHCMSSLPAGVPAPAPPVLDSGPFTRLGLDEASCRAVVDSSAEEIASLRAALLE